MENHLTVLTVEDELHIRQTLVAYFSDLGYEVLEAENGTEGIEVFRSRHPDIVLTDLRMPSVSGLEVITTIAREAPDTPVIVVSGTGVLNDAIEAVRAGAWDYITKPILDMAVLGHVTTMALDRARLVQENRRYQVGLEEQVAERTEDLQRANEALAAEIEERKVVEKELTRYKEDLEGLVSERTSELKAVHQELLEVSHRAGMSEIATGILHNVGNVLNSVNISTSLINDQLTHSKIEKLGKAVELVKEHEGDLGHFVTEHPQGKHLVPFLSELSTQLALEQNNMLQELESLDRNIEHIKKVIYMQQSYAGRVGVTEVIHSLPSLLEDAVQMNITSVDKHKVEIVRKYGDVPPLVADRHKIIQILVNLLSNARHALAASTRDDGLLEIVLTLEANSQVHIEVNDNGVGIPPENLVKVFSHGFTTREDGRGFGLHVSACAAREIGGMLTVHSDGPGKGASFVLEFPFITPSMSEIAY